MYYTAYLFIFQANIQKTCINIIDFYTDITLFCIVTSNIHFNIMIKGGDFTAYIYVQQNSALGESIPYPSPAHPDATVATSGCGVCASLMALENLTKYKYSLKKWTAMLIKAGCRANDGTDMQKVCAFLYKKYAIEYHLTTSISQVAKCLKSGGGVIANVGGKGYFSSEGHFVYVAAINSSGTLSVLDPYYYDNKYTQTVNGIKRKKYFKYNKKTHILYCNQNVLSVDRRGYFYLLKPTKKIKNPAKSKYSNGVYELLYNMKVRTGAGTNYKTKKVKNLTKDGKAHALSGNSNAEAVLRKGTRVSASIVYKNKEYWMKIPSGYVCLEKNGKVYAKKVR